MEAICSALSVSVAYLADEAICSALSAVSEAY